MWRSQSWSGIGCSSSGCSRSAWSRSASVITACRLSHAKPLLLALLLVLGAFTFNRADAQSPSSPGYAPPQAPWSAPPPPSPPPPSRADSAAARERIDRIESEIAGVREQRLRVEQALRNTPDPREPADAGRNAAEAARLAAEQSRLQAREDQLRRELTALQPKR
jgi:hypothetical protein